MRILPLNNYVLCVKHETISNNTGIIVVNDLSFDTYKVVDISCTSKELTVSKDDIVVVNSTGTKVKIGEDVFYLFNVDNIVATMV